MDLEYFDGLVKDFDISNANPLDIPQSFTKPFIWYIKETQSKRDHGN